jgi:hypothetical protein
MQRWYDRDESRTVHSVSSWMVKEKDEGEQPTMASNCYTVDDVVGDVFKFFPVCQ